MLNKSLDHFNRERRKAALISGFFFGSGFGFVIVSPIAMPMLTMFSIFYIAVAGTIVLTLVTKMLALLHLLDQEHFVLIKRLF